MAEIKKIIDYATQLKSIISVFQETSVQEQQGGVLSTPQTIEERAAQRVHNENVLRQKNIEDVIQGAAERLAHEEPRTQAQPVEEDWLREFKVNVQDISEKEMKLIWSKVLAGEIKTPKSYSRRTLHLLRTLSKDDAAIITKIAPFTLFEESGKRVIIHERNKDSDMLNFRELLFLNELGLLETSSSLGTNWSFDNNTNNYSNCIKLYNGSVGINIYTNQKEYTLPTYVGTVLGNQIFSLIEEVTPNTDYYKNILQNVLSGCRCVCGHIKEDKGDNGFIFSDEIFKIG